MVGNGFHLPSVMLALLLLFQLAPQSQAITLYMGLPDAQEEAVRRRICHTAFDPQVVKAFPGVLTPAAIRASMQAQLPMLPPAHRAWRCIDEWDEDHTRMLQSFWIFSRMQGHDDLECGPEWAMQRRRAQVIARLGAQRAAGDSKHGLDHLLSPGLGKEEHIKQAQNQGNPFGQDMPLDADLRYAIEAMVRWGVHLSRWRDVQRHALLACLTAMQPLHQALDSFRSETSKAVAAIRDIAGIAFLTAIMRWPDHAQARGYLEGFEVVGNIATSRIFRPIAASNLDETFFGTPAIEEVREALQAQPPLHADAIHRLTLEEIDKGFTEPLCTASDLDARFGIGQWRPIYRFLLHQGEKERLIDDGRRGGQNDWSAMSETIYTIGLDLVPALAHSLAHKTMETYGKLPPWFQLQLGTDDLPDAFRGCPIHPAHQRAAVVAVWDPGEESWKFGVMKGCPFGLGSVVVTFNRYPTLVTAALRRLLGLACAAYFDDNLLVDFEHSAASGKQLLKEVFTLVGTPPKPSKSFPMQGHRAFLGAIVDLMDVHPEGSGEVCVAPKDSSRRQVALDIAQALAHGNMTTAQAAKTVGAALGWAPTALANWAASCFQS